MHFHFLSAFGSGEVIDRQRFDSATFDRGQLARYADLIDKGPFVVDLGDVHLDYRPVGAKSASVEVLSESSFVVVQFLGSVEDGPDAAGEPLGEITGIDARPLVLALLPEGVEEAPNLARYPLALAAAFFEARCG